MLYICFYILHMDILHTIKLIFKMTRLVIQNTHQVIEEKIKYNEPVLATVNQVLCILRIELDYCCFN